MSEGKLPQETLSETPEPPKPFTLPRLSDDELRQFVIDVLGDRIFTSNHVPTDDKRALGMVFLPIAFGVFKDASRADLEQIGGLWEYISEAGPKSFNGLPQFFSVRMMHVDDWNRAWDAIAKELERQKTLQV
jgi:hypothetical protein